MKKYYTTKNYRNKRHINKEDQNYRHSWLVNDDYILYYEISGYRYDKFYTKGKELL
jgi:hypothetical protein